MLVFTSYFANKVIQDKEEIVSISRYSPKWMKDIEEYKALAPSKEILMSYKDSPDEMKYTIAFNKQLSALDVRATYEELDGKVICCYEKEGDFCHRNIVSKWFNTNGYLSLPYKKEYFIAVIGSRVYDDYEELKRELDEIVIPMIKIGISVTIVSGGARGADNLAEKYAYENDLQVLLFPADWDKHGKSAGYIRNSDIIEKCDLCVAFWDGESKGTKHGLNLCVTKQKIAAVFTNESKHILDARK